MAKASAAGKFFVDDSSFFCFVFVYRSVRDQMDLLWTAAIASGELWQDPGGWRSGSRLVVAGEGGSWWLEGVRAAGSPFFFSTCTGTCLKQAEPDGPRSVLVRTGWC